MLSGLLLAICFISMGLGCVAVGMLYTTDI
jgi:hypothetical protein